VEIVGEVEKNLGEVQRFSSRPHELEHRMGLALFSIQQTDLTSFSEDGRGVKWLCN
jgi:LAS superfamily LD-carboxypeptidase LdcB